MIDRNLIGVFGGVLKDIILNKKGMYGKSLQKVALLSFCKFMVISRAFCVENLNVRSANRDEG